MDWQTVVVMFVDGEYDSVIGPFDDDMAADEYIDLQNSDAGAETTFLITQVVQP